MEVSVLMYEYTKNKLAYGAKKAGERNVFLSPAGNNLLEPASLSHAFQLLEDRHQRLTFLTEVVLNMEGLFTNRNLIQ
ncbi:hypothetical protein SAMN05444266_109179 [Chitinophaga jiangningensis]|uniref:Uncharacterized protein n=1 Tax=Chitinophaga jiangningensis TaxID=1419482 RepID=A0A1M7K6K2_9BACT|nr:hypothetical protein SAMN05444266_109179 [Chitinophaga jiangningensis]